MEEDDMNMKNIRRGFSRASLGFYTDADGNNLSYGGVLLFGSGAEYQWHKMTLFADGFNLSGRHYRDHGGVPMPGTTFMAGVRLDL